MKRITGQLLILLLVPIIFSCNGFSGQSTPEGYVRNCVNLLTREGLYADSDEWQVKKKEVLASAKGISTLDEAHSLVQDAASVAGGKHSFIQAPVTDTATYNEVLPEVKMLEEGIIHIVLPAHSGAKVSDSLYIHTVFDYLQGHLDAKGVILDFRGNTGGNMYPMITAVSPLLPEGIVLKFKTRKRTSPITLEYVTGSCGITSGQIGKFPSSTPVAILTDDHTASSGEATLLCFRGLDNAKTFGGPSAGYASGNMTHILSDGYIFAITQSSDVARTGEVFCEDPIEPDYVTETPLEDAIAWIGVMDK